MRKRILLISLWVCMRAIGWAQPDVSGYQPTIVNAQPIEVNTFSQIFKIVHIGDSHLQADWFSGALRNQLQRVYGNAGLGLVFPYKAIRTNGPNSYTTWSNTPLTSSKLIKCKTADCAVGISAYNAILPSGTELVFSLKNDSLSHFISLLYDAQDQQAIRIDGINNTASYRIQEGDQFYISSLTSKVASRFSITADSYCVLHGVVLNNGNPGVLYHTIGANGATFNNYNRAPVFWNQLASLEPNLVLISLGTNESVSDLTRDSFNLQLTQFLNNLRTYCPNAQLMYTTPADNAIKQVITHRKKVKGKWRTRKSVVYRNNPQLDVIRNTLIEHCTQHRIMYWDLYEAMGGKGSITNWVDAGYAAKDHIHFSKIGYEFQAELFYQALKTILSQP